MTRKRTLTYLLFGIIALGAAGVLASRSFSAGETTVSALAGETHFHGLAVDPRDPDRLYLATHHGLFLVGPAGTAQPISESRDDFMGFTPHPADPNVLYASGHPPGGGNLGFIVSRDGGKSWSKLADGVGGPVDFHQMDVSKHDPKVIYGVYGGLQRSADGGRSWTMIGPAPEGLIDLAAGRLRDRLYAATRQGLLRSSDGGRRWEPAHMSRRPVTMVYATNDGRIYAYVVGIGLIHAEEPGLDWKVRGGGIGGSYVLHLAVAPTDKRRLYAVAFNPTDRSQSLLVSTDGGESWSALGGE
jgi:photosystem II stability/assembly factor-like uncharacterized protein